MKHLSKHIFSVIAGILLFSQITYAQEEEITDDLGNVSDKFQEYFFEALKQKGIENYDRAIDALEKAAKEKPEEAVVYFEMGKNYLFLKRYETAEEHFQKTIEKTGEKPEVLERLYEVYYQTGNDAAAIDVVKKLILSDSDYKEDLATLYVRTEQYAEALKILDELDRSKGNNDYRNQLRQQIYAESSDASGQIADLKNRIERNPNAEQDYLNLIYLYSQENNTEAAFETALQLLKNKPDSELVHLALYKFYLEKNNPDEAVNSMQIVLRSDVVDEENKFKVLNGFLLFVNDNPAYENNLEKMIALYAEEENSPEVYEQLGNYYLQKEKYAEALHYFEIGVSKNTADFNLIKSTVLLQLDFKKNEEARKLSENALEIFPTQPLLYLLNGAAYNQLGNHKKAIAALEMGIDFLIDDPKMERDFYLQLKTAYEAQGNPEKAAAFAEKAERLSGTDN